MDGGGGGAKLFQKIILQTLPKAQRTQGIKFDSINDFISWQTFQQSLKSWSIFSFVLFGKGQEIHVTTLSHSCNNFNKTT